MTETEIRGRGRRGIAVRHGGHTIDGTRHPIHLMISDLGWVGSHEDGIQLMEAIAAQLGVSANAAEDNRLSAFH